MDITPITPKDRLVISHYGNGGFVVNGVAHKGNILITPDRVVPWGADSIADATPESLAALFSGEPPEIVLVGLGIQFAPLSAALRAFFREKNVAADAMDTGAACRTYSVLLTEGRMVAAALIAV